jgi:CRISPR/Cas system CMR-associated protein Cmr5 small subunit
MSMKLRNLELAGTAMEIVENVATGKNKSEIIELLRKLPSHIQTSGLGQTLAWLLKKNPDIAKQVCRGVEGSRQEVDANKFLGRLIRGSASEYRRKSRQALAFAEWLKRFADAEKKKIDG